jgi:hypothetical protein
MRTKEAIAQELATERAKLDELEHQLSTVRAKIDTLRAELHAARTAKPSPPPFPSLSPVKPRTPQPRRSNFSDRCFQGTPTSSPSDSSARKPPTPGYAPACSNKWEPGLCHLKSGGKCDCPTQFFVPVENRVVIDHLRGRHDERGLPTLEPSIFLQSNAVRTSGSHAGGFVGASQCKR